MDLDIKVCDEKTKFLQSHLPFLENLIKLKEAVPTGNPAVLEKLKKLFNLIESLKFRSLEINVLLKIENAVTELKKRQEIKNAPSVSVVVKKEMSDVSDKASVCESVSETPDSPSPTRHYERTSPIEIPTERSDDREYKLKRERDHRYDDNRSYRHDNQRSDRSGHSRYDGADRHRSRYDQHERSKSRDRYKHDRRSNSSERSRHRNDRNRNESDKHRYSHDREKYDPFEQRDHSSARKKYEDRTDRTNGRNFKTENNYERSGRYSPPSHRDNKKLGKNIDGESHNSAFSRLGARVPSAVPMASPSDNKSIDSEVTEMMARNSMLYGCDSDDDEINAIKSLTEVRSKLANQIKLAESLRNKDNRPPSVVANNDSPSELSKISLNAPAKKAGSKFELNSLRKCTPTPSNYQVKEDSTKFSFMKTFNQTSKSAEVPTTSKDSIKVDDDIIKKLVTQPVNEASTNKVSPIIPNMDLVKKALTTVKLNEERLALKYNPKARARADQNTSEPTAQPHQSEASQSNNPQLVCTSDPRLPRVRDPRVQAHQDIRMQAFSPPSTPPCISNYPPIMQSNSGYQQTSYPKPGLLPNPNHYQTHPGQQSSYPRAMSPQHHLQSHSNLIAIPPHVPTYNNQRNHHQASPVSSTDVSPPIRYSYQPPTFSEPNRNSSGIHTNFRPSLNDSVERQKYEQSRSNRRSSGYYESNEGPRTYGEYRRLQSAVSSTSEKVNNNETITRPSTNDISTSYHDNVYRTGNYSTPIPTVATKAIGSKFKIPKKTSNETAKLNEIRTENWDSKQDSEDEQINVTVVKDIICTVKDSDDSEHEISGRTVNSDSETSDCRDPRIRALKKVTQSTESKAKDSTEKQNNVVTSSTSIVPDHLTSKESMETVLKQLMNPENLLALINLAGLSGDNTLLKVKEVLEMRVKETSTSVPNEESTEKSNTPTEREKIDTPKTPKKKKQNELEKLNEDIRTMFISDGVLNATGRRVCALYNNADKEPIAPKRKPKLQSKDDVGIEKQQKQDTSMGSRLTRRRNTMVCYTEPSGRLLRPVARDASKERPAEPTTAAGSKSTQEAKTTTTPEPKTITPEPKVAKKATKAAKTTKKTKATKAVKGKKTPEPIEDSDEPPTKRVTRAQLKECNIVLEKLSPGASVESLTNAECPKKDGKGKRPRTEALVTKPAAKKAKKDPAVSKTTVKNTNPEHHSLTKVIDCHICGKQEKLSLISHYVNVHPNSEVITSRLAPDVADSLRNSKEDHKCERLKQPGKNYHEFTQFCHFCNVSKCFTKLFWINHMAKHTGYYQYKCCDCSRKFAEKNLSHMCKTDNNLEKIPQPQFQNENIQAYICDLCNYVRFRKEEIEKHLSCEHNLSVTNKFKEITFLSFPKKKTKAQLEEERADESTEDVINQTDPEEIENNTPKRQKLNSDKELSENATEKVLRSRVVNTEAFIGEPKEDDGLFDKDTMKLMKDMSFSASKDGESTSRPNRAKSIAEKLSERFNLVQEDNECKSEDKEQTKIEPLDPLTCDEGIPIIRVTANDDDPIVQKPVVAVTVTEIEKTSPCKSPSSTSNRENACTPTEEFVDESDENWESYSSSDSDEEAETVDESVVPIQRQPNNRKNVGIIDTIQRLQQSISLQGASTQSEAVERSSEAVERSSEAVEKSSEATLQEDQPNVKDEGKSETISASSEQLDASITQSEDEKADAVKSSQNETEVQKNVTLTYETIVSEAMQVDGEETDADNKAKTCVSNGRPPNGNYSFNLKGTTTTPQLGSRNNSAGSSSNSDLSNNDVEMEDINKPAKILTRIDNIGYTRSTSSIDSSVTFCCLINQCGFESTDLSDLLTHIDDHPIEWFGFCYTCNTTIHNNRVQLMMEFKHMTQIHYNKKADNEIIGKADNAGRPAFIKCKLLPGDKLSKLKEAEIAAKAEQLSINPKPSTSSSTKPEPMFLKIANVTSLTTTATKSNSPSPSPSPTPALVIAKVVSLNSSSREYNDSEMVSIKAWKKERPTKLQKNCKKMLRDISLYALYKCMETNCAFTTDNADSMLTHLLNHENSPQADNATNAPSYLECSYCDVVKDTCTRLVKHIQEEHQSSIFQCPYCFYRSCVAYNVVVHLNQFHKSEKKLVLVCNGKPRLYATEKALIEKSRMENIRPLRCTEDCNKITYVMDYFVKHMINSDAHTDKFKCQFCGFNTLISETAKHLLVHSVGVYECVYCHYGINDVESIQNHMCNTHPSKLLYICVRLTRKNKNLTDEQQSSVESTLIFHLGQTVDNKLFQRCPFTDAQLSYMSPLVASNSNKTPIPSFLGSAPSELGIASVTSISNESFTNAETVTSSNTGLVFDDVLSYKDLEKEYMTDDWDKYFATLSDTPQPSTSKRKSSTTQAMVEMPENKRTSTSTSARPDLLQDEIDIAAYFLVKGTGLEGRDLYRCSFANCEENSNDIFVFNVHLLQHNQSQIGFKCYHCNVVSKNIVGLKYHIKVHGIHRYFCYYCNYTSAIVNDIQKHMQDTHSRHLVHTIALNPKKHDQNKDMFVMCPRGLRQDELNRFGVTLIERHKRQQTSTKKFYSPDDIDSLPRQEIFKSFISCEVCDYSTKVRTNMYRHLLAHKDERSVPKTDPVNPVPCLDSGEKHFDKMINLACSSNDGKTSASFHYDLSAFVPEGRRFVCNARNCQYQNISENMLKRHLTTLHPNEEQYKCPHCNTLISQKMDADKVVNHLRMHDSKIYKCPKCAFSHHLKSVVDKHRDESHAGVLDQAILITRDETTSASLDGQPKVSKWKCDLCNELCATQKLVQAHIQTAHSIKFQYQCDICSEVQSNNKMTIQEHINSKHPNQGSRIKTYYTKIECAENDNTPIWRRDDPNKIKHIRGILFEEENVRKSTTTKKDQTEVKKKTSQKKRSDKPVVEQNSDIGDVPVINESETNSPDDSESKPILIVSDEDTDVDKHTNEPVKKSPSLNPTPSTSKNLLESGKSFMGSSKALIKLPETVVRAEATSSGIKSKKESSLDKAYLCGRCFNFSDNTIALVRAHQATAHPNVLCEILMRNTDNESQQNKNLTKHLPDVKAVISKPKSLDSINYVCYHCIFKSQNPNVIYKHWKENHKFPKITTKNIEFPSRPFMFKILKIFQCYYCRRSSHYKDLKVHSQKNHPMQPFVMIDNMNPKKCGLCSHEFNDVGTEEIVDHFKESHKNLLTDSTEPDNHFTDELLDKVIELLPKEQVRCSQSNCNVVFFSMDELIGHTKEKHSGSQMKYVSIPNDPVMYGCSCFECTVTNSNECSMIAHIREHLLEFQCKLCEKRFKYLEMIKVHHEIMHNFKDETYRNIDVNEHLDKYLAMKIIFPNGYVLTKSDAKRTRYGSMDKIIKLVTEMNERDLEVVRKQQEEKVEKAKEPLLVKNINAKRLRIIDSDSDNSEKTVTPPKKPTTKLRKRRKLNSDSTNVPSKPPEYTQPKEEVISTSDDNEPLQRLIPFTYYGKKPQRMNLSKVFIQMPFGDSTVRVSCDRFSLLFNINPKLRLKRC